MENQLALMYTVFSFCYSREVSVTFHNNESTWIGAVQYCKSIGAVIYSDEKDIRNRTEYEVWTGKYKILTPWAITLVLGCYEIDPKKVYEVAHGNQAECQKICMGTDYFAVRQSTCMCLQLADLNTGKIKGPCNCSNCATVLRNRFFNKPGVTSCPQVDSPCFCMAATCKDRNLKLTSENCDKSYKIICDDRTEYQNGGYGSNFDAKTFCNNQNSFVRWYEQSDICPNGSVQHWTSGMRVEYGYTVKYTDEVSKLNPLECFRVARSNTEEREYVECDRVYPFFCQAGSSVYKDTTSTRQFNDSYNIAGAIGGSISAILIIAIVAVTSINLYKRRIPSRTIVSLNSIVKDEPSTSRKDGYTVNAAYEQLNKTDNDQRTRIQAYDQLHSVHVADTTFKTNTRMSIEDETKYESIDDKNEKYNNAVTSDYEKLDLADIEQIKNMYDPLYYKHVEDSDTTNARSNTIDSNDENRKYETSASKIETDLNAVPLEYEQLEITHTDTSTRVYDQLHNSDSKSTNNRPNIIISREEQTNDKSSEDK